MADFRAGPEKVQYEPGTSCCAKKQESTQRMLETCQGHEPAWKGSHWPVMIVTDYNSLNKIENHEFIQVQIHKWIYWEFDEKGNIYRLWKYFSKSSLMTKRERVNLQRSSLGRYHLKYFWQCTLSVTMQTETICHPTGCDEKNAVWLLWLLCQRCIS